MSDLPREERQSAIDKLINEVPPGLKVGGLPIQKSLSNRLIAALRDIKIPLAELPEFDLPFAPPFDLSSFDSVFYPEWLPLDCLNSLQDLTVEVSSLQDVRSELQFCA